MESTTSLNTLHQNLLSMFDKDEPESNKCNRMDSWAPACTDTLGSNKCPRVRPGIVDVISCGPSAACQGDLGWASALVVAKIG